MGVGELLAPVVGIGGRTGLSTAAALVNLPSVVALTPPERTKHWPVACDRDGAGELFGS
jgi:hypothetical protein